MHYLIDGYNLIFRFNSEEENLEAQRQELIERLNEHPRLKLTLIFDAHNQEDDLRRTHYKNVEILYSGRGETADDLILTMIENAEVPGNYTVVTSDKQLASAFRRHGGRSVSAEAFLKKI